jgi:hypothetical protein
VGLTQLVHSARYAVAGVRTLRACDMCTQTPPTAQRTDSNKIAKFLVEMDSLFMYYRSRYK